MRPSRYTIFDVAEHFGLAVELRHDLPDCVAGFLDRNPEPQFIAVNANLPRFEQVFTIAHELGHYVKHRSCAPLSLVPPWLNLPWKSARMQRLLTTWQRCVNRSLGMEWQADLWALCALFRLGAAHEVRAWLAHHPERSGLVLLVSLVAFPIIIRNLFLHLIRTTLRVRQAV